MLDAKERGEERDRLVKREVCGFQREAHNEGILNEARMNNKKASTPREVIDDLPIKTSIPLVTRKGVPLTADSLYSLRELERALDKGEAKFDSIDREKLKEQPSGTLHVGFDISAPLSKNGGNKENEGPQLGDRGEKVQDTAMMMDEEV